MVIMVIPVRAMAKITQIRPARTSLGRRFTVRAVVSKIHSIIPVPAVGGSFVREMPGLLPGVPFYGGTRFAFGNPCCHIDINENLFNVGVTIRVTNAERYREPGQAWP